MGETPDLVNKKIENIYVCIAFIFIDWMKKLFTSKILSKRTLKAAKG